eukprot:c24079_g1_i2 orf=564-1205(-)
MASSSVAATPSSGPSDWKKMKIQELREALTSTEIGNVGFRFPSSERSVNASMMVASPGISTAVKIQSQDKLSRQGKKGISDTVAKRSKEAGGNARATSKSKYVSDSTEKAEETPASVPKYARQEANESNRNVAVTSGLLTDLERKQKRAQRFGVELQVSEQEKWRLRAERFGMQGQRHGDKTESEKRQARAARFGIVDEEAKKKARSERFGLE